MKSVCQVFKDQSVIKVSQENQEKKVLQDPKVVEALLVQREPLV